MRARFCMIALLLLSPTLYAEEDIFRIDVVVFAQDQADAQRAFRLGERLVEPEIPDLSDLEAPVRPQPVEDSMGVADPEPEVNDAFLRALFDESANPVDGQPAVALNTLLEPLGDDFDQIIDRLKRQPALEVLTVQRWYQPAAPFEDPHYLRLHGDVDLSEDASLTASADEQLTFWQGLADSEPAQPVDPLWQLDGRIAFTEGTYFHLWLDAFYRQDMPAALPFAQRTARGIEAVDELVHHLQGRHRLRLGEWLYFDSPHLGAIARVVRYEAPEPVLED
jgi:hypothetical protein